MLPTANDDQNIVAGMRMIGRAENPPLQGTRRRLPGATILSTAVTGCLRDQSCDTHVDFGVITPGPRSRCPLQASEHASIDGVEGVAGHGALR